MSLYIDRNAPGAGLASLMAARGRGGDTELVHMTKPEVKRLMSTGLMSLNPKTGLPEYFLGSIFKGIKNFAKKLFKPKVGLGILASLLAGPVATALIPGTLFGAAGNLAGTLASGVLRGGITGAASGLPWGMKGMKKGALAGAVTGGLSTAAAKASQAMRGTKTFGPEANPYDVSELEKAGIMRSKVLPEHVDQLYEKYGTVEGAFDPVVEDFAQEVLPFGTGEIPSSETVLAKLGVDSTPSNLRAIENINLGRSATPSQIRSIAGKLPISMESPEVLQRKALGSLGYINPKQIAAAGQFSDIRPPLSDVLKPETYKQYFKDKGISGILPDLLLGTSTTLDAEKLIKEDELYEASLNEKPEGIEEEEEYVQVDRPFTFNALPRLTEQQLTNLYIGGVEPRTSGKRFFEPTSGKNIFAKEGGLLSLQDGGAFEGQVQGDGHGMQDNVMMPINGGGIAAVSPKEYVVPADVMAMLGNGNADEGAKSMDGFISKFRKRKYGRDMQPPETDATKALQSLIIS